MFRRHLIDLLANRPMSVRQIAREAGVLPAEVEADLRHLLRSLRHTDQELMVSPAECRKCGFVFATDKLRKPSKCPECRSTWIDEPLVEVRPRQP